ncbi:substrate-binding domain-containing protein [Streptomyces lushanensis]|uniref:substrate-binding domain-containing protein n=1 Tax=Streptomyces lushanensis TaxID=1434255 RepID=UPI000A9779D7|nr:substrate-binding domain-containing protein [Streptomyces lushanensis]
MNVKSRIRMAAAVGAAAFGLSLLTTPASADPPPPPAPYRTLVGVGSDTTQDVVNGLGDVITSPTIASYNATGPSPIKTRAVNCSIARPNGSSAGIDALRADLSAPAGSTTKNCIDFARSSRGPANLTTTLLTWVPFAKDAVTVAVRSDSALNSSTAPLNLDTAKLKLIYTCDPAWRSLNGVTLTPLLPQTGSGTRTFFLEKIGVTEAQVGSCVDGTVQEHNGLALDTAGDIAPYSIAQYIAQTSGVVTDRHGATVLLPVGGVQPRNGDGTLNVSFPYNRDVYNVVPTAKIDGGATADDANLKDAFVGTGSDVCQQTDVITAYGFGLLGGDCGATAIKGER